MMKSGRKKLKTQRRHVLIWMEMVMMKTERTLMTVIWREVMKLKTYKRKQMMIRQITVAFLASLKFPTYPAHVQKHSIDH